jgi:formamidopyrimidine-DNA glycosylase
MPELPEVETVRRTVERALLGQRLVDVEVADDGIVFQGVPPSAIREALLGCTVNAVGRKGKFWWIRLEEGRSLVAHLGMAGWVREMGRPSIRLREHGEAPFDDENGRPRFLKFALTGANGRTIVMTDGRRLARAWMSGDPESDSRILQLGPDVLNSLPSTQILAGFLKGRKAPIKALLQDQTWLSGIGNWIADEVLFHARIAPARPGASLSVEEVDALRAAIGRVVRLAVDVGADSTKYPQDWLFNVRWGGGRGDEFHQGMRLVREQVGGRTTAWVPDLQK